MEIPVVKKIRDTFSQGVEVHMLDVSKIWYATVDYNKFVVFHTKDDVFYQPSNMEQISAVLKSYNFEKLDRGMLVNMNNIQHVDEEYKKIYFEKEFTPDSKYATVSYSKMKKLKNLLASRKLTDTNHSNEGSCSNLSQSINDREEKNNVQQSNHTEKMITPMD